MKYAFASLSLLLAVPSMDGALAESISLDDPRWTFSGQVQTFETYKGEDAVYLQNGSMTLNDLSFFTGTIEFDIASTGERGFSGIRWRVQDGGHDYEHFYIRPHQSGNPDANQYNPVHADVAAWQLMFGPAFSAPTVYKVDEWMHVRVEVYEDQADIFIDSDQPILRIDNLRGDFGSGTVAISSGYAPSRFANIVVTPGENNPETPIPMVAPLELPGLIKGFDISAAMSFDRAKALLESNHEEQINWQRVPVESYGALNIARYRALAPEADTVIVRVPVDAKPLRFGYSDRVTAFYRGNAIYQGDNGYMSRDYRYLGTIGLFDSLMVPASDREGYLYFAVSESFGGWGFMAATGE